MLIFDNDNTPIILESVTTPTVAEYIWVLDLNLMDYTLAPLLVLEEIEAKYIEVMIDGFQFPLPATWNILVVDEQTFQLDVVSVKDVAGTDFKALIYGPNMPNFEMATIRATNLYPNHRSVSPSLYKHQMLCHPIAPGMWVNVAPSDTYNKYLKNALVGDLI